MTPVSATHAFSLPRLPLEIQMMVLRECLTSKTPLLDYGAKPGGIQLTIVDEPGGQDDICFGILGTCKLYHEEGLKVLYAQNRFSYTESFETDERSLSRPLPAEPKSKHLSYSTQHFPYLKHLILRTMGGTTYPGSRRTIMRCQSLLAQCLHLQTLQLDFVSLPRESTKFETTILIFMNCLLSYSRMSRFIAQRPREEPRELRAENGRLRQLIITGLRADFCGLLAVIHASCLLADGGKLGVGMGGVREYWSLFFPFCTVF